MKTLSDYYSRVLIIVKPKFFKRDCELITSEGVIGRLTYPRLFGRNAVAEMFDKKWEIKRESLLLRKFHILEEGTSIPLAFMKRTGFRRYVVELPKGERIFIEYGWVLGNIEILTELETVLVKFRRKIGMKEKAEVKLLEKSGQLDNYPWIIMFAWYLEMIRRRKRRR